MMVRQSKKRVKRLKNPTSEDGLDRIDSLPDDVLGHMLSFLPTRFAVSTSILSKRWRYLFTLTTCLSFDDTPCLSQPTESERLEATRKFKEFVDNVLRLHQISPIKKFSLLCGHSYNKLELSRWFGNAIQKGVQELHYELANHNDNLPDAIFMCATLSNLKMIDREFKAIQIPISASLPKLKILHLYGIRFVDFNSMEMLFSSCELLEELTLNYCGCDRDGHLIYRTEVLKRLTAENCSFPLGTFVIYAPNLEFLTYNPNTQVKVFPSSKYSCSLVKAELTFDCTAHEEFAIDEDELEYARQLLKVTAYATTKLRFQVESAEAILTLDEDEQMPDFPSLSSLNLNDCPYDAWKYLTSLLDKAPQLETLIFESGFHCCRCSYYPCHYECYCDSLSPSDIPLDPFSCHAQVIEVHNFCRHKGSMSLMGHLLRNASSLKSLIIYTYNITTKEEFKIRKAVLSLPRASRDCCIEMKPELI